MSNFAELKAVVEQAWENRAMLEQEEVKAVIRAVVEAVDKGELRTAEPIDLENSEWQVNEWVKKAIIMYFPIQKMRTMRAGELEWYDKIELKHDYEKLGVRVVPHAMARYGAHSSPSIDHSATINISTNIHIRRHQNRAWSDICSIASHCVRHNAHA